MGIKDQFEFLNSETWLRYTQQRYLTTDEIKYRLKQSDEMVSDAKWSETAAKIVSVRKMGAVTLFFKSLSPRFWFYPSDAIQKKIDEIERLGKDLNHRIISHAAFKKDLLLNSQIEEAITSAIYEGAHSTRAQAKELIASGKTPKNKDEWMLVNNYRAMKWIHENTDEKLSKDTILNLHQIVTHNTLEGDDVNFSGQFRNDVVSVGPHDGISHEKIEAAIEEMIGVISENQRYFHPLIKCILVHYFTAYIHPFFDGNGRTARALFYFKAMRNQLTYIELLSVSAYLKEHGRQYEKSFEKVVENDHDVTFFIDFCLDSMCSAFKEVSKKVTYLLQMLNLREALGLSDSQIGLLQRMALHKFRLIDIETYAEQIKMSRESARPELKVLVDLGLLNETKVSKKFVYRINANKLEEVTLKSC